MALERRVLLGFLQEETTQPGIVEELDGTMWLVNPDGSRTQLPGGGGGGCAYFTCDTGTGTATVDAPNAADVIAGVINLAAQADPGGVPRVGASAATDAETRAQFEVGISGAADETGYVNISAQNLGGDRSVSVGMAGDDTNGGALLVQATDDATVVVQPVAEGLTPSVALAMNAVDSSFRGEISIATAGVTDDTTTARVAAQADGGQAEFRAAATVGGSADAIVSADKLHFNAGPAIDRPALDPVTATAQDVAQALIDLGLAVAL